MVPFLKELIFDRKEESEFTSVHFKPYKWLSYMGVILFVVISLFSIYRTIALSKYVVEHERSELLDQTMSKARAVRIKELESRVEVLEDLVVGCRKPRR